MRKKKNSLVGAFIFAAFVVFLLISGLYHLDVDYEFDHSVLRTTGTVEGLWTSSGSKGGTHYHVSYRYQAFNVIYSGGSIPASQITYHQLSVGSTVPIKFLIADPTQSRIDTPYEEQWQWHNDEVLVGVCLFFGLVGSAITWLKRSGRPQSSTKARADYRARY